MVWSSDEEEQLEEEVEEVQVVEEEEDVEEEYEGGTYYTDEELTRAAGSKTANEKKRQRGSFASTPPSVTLKGGKYAPKSATAKSVQKPQTSPRLHAIHMRPDVCKCVPTCVVFPTPSPLRLKQGHSSMCVSRVSVLVLL